MLNGTRGGHQTKESEEPEACYSKVREKLKGLRRMMARAIKKDDCKNCGGKSGLLFDCATHTWCLKDIKKLHSWMDKCYRSVWGSGRSPPLRQMQEETCKISGMKWK